MNQKFITIFNPLPIWSAGKRVTNEDYMYPLPTELSASTRLFLVCDGIGSATKGGIASKLACETFIKYYQQQQFPQLTKESVKQAIRYIQAYFTQYILSDASAEKMSTTLALLQIQPQQILIAHIGDSRIYQIRNGEKIFVTRDHRYVNELIDKGKLDETDALNHPQRNVITKAVQASTLCEVQPTVHTLQDIQPNDYFFICTDGIQEGIREWELLTTLADDSKNNMEKNQVFKQLCEQNAADNYTSFLIQIKTVSATMPTT